MFGMVQIDGLATGVFGSITLRIRPDAPIGTYETTPEVDSVYTLGQQRVSLVIRCEPITIEHTFNTGVITKAPDCLNTGIKTYTCIHCDASKTESVPAKGHTWDNGVITQAPTAAL